MTNASKLNESVDKWSANWWKEIGRRLAVVCYTSFVAELGSTLVHSHQEWYQVATTVAFAGLTYLATVFQGINGK